MEIAVALQYVYVDMLREAVATTQRPTYSPRRDAEAVPHEFQIGWRSSGWVEVWLSHSNEMLDVRPRVTFLCPLLILHESSQLSNSGTSLQTPSPFEESAVWRVARRRRGQQAESQPWSHQNTLCGFQLDAHRRRDYNGAQAQHAGGRDNAED